MMEKIFAERILILCVGFGLDLLFGDPHFLWHPVRGMGAVITRTERMLRRSLHIREGREQDKKKKLVAGIVLVVVTVSVSVGLPALLLYGAGRIHPGLKTGLACILCYQMLAMKSLRTESMKVYEALQQNDLQQARYAVSMIVGRDTERLTEEGVIRATVETVAENTSDGVAAPLFYMVLFGALGGVFYKAVNTMDSMVGYKNEKYCYLGRAAAKLDDAVNFLPARIAAYSMLLAAFLLRLDEKNAYRIFKRDRYCHASPNSAQTEAVCAGALSVQLAGDAWYFGELYHKPTIGDPVRRIGAEDISLANRLLYGTGWVMLVVGIVCLATAAAFAAKS